jgi:hypothetical protein
LILTKNKEKENEKMKVIEEDQRETDELID